MTTRAVLDTNVLVSGLGWGGPPAAILDAVSDGRVVLITSAPLIDELRRSIHIGRILPIGKFRLRPTLKTVTASSWIGMRPISWKPSAL